MSRRLLVLATCVLLVAAACGSSGSSSGPPGAATAPGASAVPIDTVVDDGTAIVEVGRAASAAASSNGGNLTATGSNGVTYSLTIPEGSALVPTDVILTPVRELRGLEGGPPLIAAARLEPAGSIFAVPLDLAIPYSGTLADGDDLYAVISSDGGKTWAPIPARLDAGVAHVDVLHFSHIALVAGPFTDEGLSYLTRTTVSTDVFRGRIVLAARGKTAEAAEPEVRELFTAWAELVREDARSLATRPDGAEIDATALLGQVSDRVAMYLAIRTLDQFLTSGDLMLLFAERDISELLDSIDLYLGASIEDAIERATRECIAETSIQPRLDVAAEQYGWFRIGEALRDTFDVRLDTPIFSGEVNRHDAFCPAVDVELLQLGPDPISAGDTPRIAGQIRVRHGDQVMTARDFAPGSRFNVRVWFDTGFAQAGEAEGYSVDSSGQADISLPPSTGDRVAVRVEVCLEVGVDSPVYPCREVQLSVGGDREIDLRGRWRGSIGGGNVDAVAFAQFSLAGTGEQSDGSQAFEGPGVMEDVVVTGYAIRLPLPFEGNLELRVYEDGRVRGTLTYEAVSSGLSVNCSGTLVGDTTLNDEADHLNFVFRDGSGCLKGPDLTLDLEKI